MFHVKPHTLGRLEFRELEEARRRLLEIRERLQDRMRQRDTLELLDPLFGELLGTLAGINNDISGLLQLLVRIESQAPGLFQAWCEASRGRHPSAITDK